MPRALRIQYEGAIYHVMNRGNRGEEIFFGHQDRELFLKTLGETCGKSGWELHAYCLMNNHFHLVVETPQPTLVAGMKWMLGTYTQRINARHQLRGHLFAGRYKALLVDESDDIYLRTVCDYTHLNPVRANLIAEDDPLETYIWSSYRAYLKKPQQRPVWLRTDRLLNGHGIQRDNARGRREFGRLMEQQRWEDHSNGLEPQIRRGWKLGAENFLDRIQDRISPAVPEAHEARQVRESMQVKARRLLSEQLLQNGVCKEDLAMLPKGATIKIEIAAELRKSTTLTLKEIAELLHAGSWRSLANALSKRKMSL